MRYRYIAIFIYFFLSSHLIAQKKPPAIHLKNGFWMGDQNLLKGKLRPRSLAASHYKKKYYALIQFNQIPDAGERTDLEAEGIQLFDYLPKNTFLAELRDSFSNEDLTRNHATGVYSLASSLKLSRRLQFSMSQGAPKPEELIAVSFFGSMKKSEVGRELEKCGATLAFTKIQPAYILFVQAPPGAIGKMAALPFVSFIDLQMLKNLPLNYNNHAIHALDALAAPSGRNLQGNSVTVGVGDNADPASHIDFNGRLIDRNANWTDGHGTHTTGTTGGGGLIDARYRGMAPQSTLISENFSDILTNAPVFIGDDQMVLTNNSYYSGLANCPGEGEYNALSNYVDAQIDQYDSLLHVFAGGNDGTLACSPYPTSFATIKSGFQCAKNVITVGAISNLTYSIANFSSCGPLNDGRIKPEIVAGGVNIISTLPFNTYGTDNGTSMSAPTVTGTLALLYERYKQLHGGSNPSSALMKAIVCNSADDLGNPGPDYIYGFGMLNARTSVEAIENNHYFTSTVANGATDTHVISAVPAGAQQLKIMLYWNDPAASMVSGPALVNNLDLTVTEPNGSTTHYPLILNPNPASVSNNATEGVDTLNNIEQVVINNPPGGNFTVNVAGATVTTPAQAYAIAYEIINPSVTVEYPFGNETWVPGQTEYIRWSAYGGSPNSFTVQYSADNGNSWNTISSNVPDTARSYAWVVPNIATNSALVKVTRNNTSYSGLSNFDFVILGQPVLTLTNPCEGYAQLLWNTVPSATGYQIMMLEGDTMQTITSTTDTTYLLEGLARDSSYWITVRAMNGSIAGRRALAGNIVPAGNPDSACNLFNIDFALDSIMSPISGRQFTSTQLGSSVPITVELRNLGRLPSTGAIPVSYQINGGNIVTENMTTAMPANSTLLYTFNTPYNFSAVGAYSLQAWVNYPGDTLYQNDTASALIKQLQNDTIPLTPSFTEGFESAAAGTYYSPTYGFTGLDRCDFFTSNSNGRARTFINTGFARTGDRCATLDQILWSETSTADSLITTFNLSNYSSSDQIWLNFYYRNQGIDFSLPGNTVWIRGNDQSAWISVDTLSILPSSFGVYLPSSNIDVTGILSQATPPQSVSSSFQVKFGEEGYRSANSVIVDGDVDNGYSFDDIMLTRSSFDVGMVALLSPNLNGICNLGSAETIQVEVKNYSHDTLTNIPVSYNVNGDTVTENISSLGPGDTLIYTFNQTANLSAYQNYNMGTWVSYPLDNYHLNDSILNINFNTVPVIATFPYLEGFETSNGYWYTNGTNDSWQWGAPQKTIINRAANGKNAWVTSLTGDYNNNELSYLYSPCFDLSSLVHPVLSFSHIFQTEDDCDCDYHWMEYSTDGINWLKLGAVGNGTNWYDDSLNQTWQMSDTLWHVSSIDIPSNGTEVRFRVVMSSDAATAYEGVGVDDVHIFERAPVYSGANIDSISQPVSGNGWVNFSVGGNMVAALNPNGQNLGNTTVKAYIVDSGSRYISGQYYLGRNLVIRPSTAPTDTVSVRFYFLDSEADSLINATGCATCTTIHDAYQSGITQYSNDPAHEDSTLLDNISGTYRFNAPHQNMTIIPNYNGYYAEFQVTGFSEFWINGGGINQNEPLALVLDSFTVTKINNNQALLQWTVLPGAQTRLFYIQKSSDSVNFATIDSVSYNSATTDYELTDSLFAGVNYYRLEMVDSSGNIQYSAIRSVTKNNSSVIQVFPNPATNGILYVNTPDNCRSIQLCDLIGRNILTENTSGEYNSLTLPNMASGVYLVIVQTDSQKQTKKILIISR